MMTIFKLLIYYTLKQELFFGCTKTQEFDKKCLRMKYPFLVSQ